MPAGVVIRPYVRGQDESTWVDVSNRAWQEDEDFVPETVENMKRWQDPPGISRARFFAQFDGVPVGIIDALVDSAFPTKGFLDGPEVVPEHRRRGVGATLTRAALDSLRASGMKVAEGWSYEHSAAGSLLESLGFRIVRRFSRMRCRLNGLPKDVGECRDAEIVPIGRTDEELTLLAQINNEAFKEHFDYCPSTAGEMRFCIKNDEDNGDRVFIRVARVRGEPAGMLMYGYSPKANDHLGKRRGHLSSLGVLKEHRGLGVAKALMLAGMAHLEREGLDEAELGVDNTNVTGAMRLYERLGFSVARSRLTWIKDLAAR